MGVRTQGCMRVYLWIGKISWRFHKHTILQISLKIWAGGLRVIPKNGETKSGPNRANSQRNTNTQNTEFMNLDSILLPCAKVIFSEMEKNTKAGIEIQLKSTNMSQFFALAPLCWFAENAAKMTKFRIHECRALFSRAIWEMGNLFGTLLSLRAIQGMVGGSIATKTWQNIQLCEQSLSPDRKLDTGEQLVNDLKMK